MAERRIGFCRWKRWWPGNAQGQVPQCDDINAVMAKAESFAKSFAVLLQWYKSSNLRYVESKNNLFITIHYSKECVGIVFKAT